jgi:organic radical activating enzyme
MHQIPTKVDFYITNVCNLTCQRCNRFNNFDFKGWQDWKDYQETYEQWSKLVSLRAITIMGGEPFLNPTLKDWVTGLNGLFSIEVQVLTNGTRFLQAKDVYETMLYKSPITNAQNHIGVSLHIPEDFEQIRADIHQFLKGDVTEFAKDQNPWGADWQFKDSNGVMINVYTVDKFSGSAIIPKLEGGYTLHDSDPAEAHSKCAFATWKSYHFVRGKFYKCGPSALLPEFDDQFYLDITDNDRELLHAYKPLTVDNFVEYHEEFFANLDNPIAQCKFCPASHQLEKIHPVRKGSKSS